MHEINRQFGFLVLAPVILAMGFGCSQGNNDSNTTSSDDTSTGSDTDTGTETITDPDFDMCADYPDADNNFDQDSIIRNYELFDKTDAMFEICELSYDFDKLLIKFNTGS